MGMGQCLRRAGLGLALIVLLGGQQGERGEAPTEQIAKEGWSYEGETGPGRWGDLKPEFVMCSIGQLQSPIDVRDALRGELAALKMDYRSAPLHVYNNGHTVGLSFEAGGELHFGRETYQLKQMHFHTSSEHAIDGKHYPAEVHLVHEAADGHVAVVGIMVEEGAANPIFGPILAAMPEIAGPGRDVPGVEVNVRDLTTSSDDYTIYKGSFTTPPCTEGVFWLIENRPVTASAAQIARLFALMGNNARPIQARNFRLIVRSD